MLSEIEVCEKECTHSEIIEKVKNEMPSEDVIYDVAELFKVFGDSTRTKILTALFESEMCVCDIAGLLGVSQSAVSHQLQILRSRRLVKYRRDGKTVFYSLNDEHIFSIIGQGIEHIKE